MVSPLHNDEGIISMASIADLLGVQWAAPTADYSLHPHAARQATSKGIAHEDVLAAANAPSHTYENRRFPGQMRHIKDGLVAVVDPSRRQIVTVYKDQEETALRPDQKDSDALAYGRKKNARGVHVGGAR